MLIAVTGTAQNKLTTDKGVVINGIKWATRNVDAPGTFTTNPEDAGMFYQWNSNIGWSATDTIISTDGSTWVYNWTGNGATTWEVANNVCPAGWRVPIHAELQNLIDAGSIWVTINDVEGRLFGSGDNTIFLPAAGWCGRFGGLFSGVGTYGIYWSSTESDISDVYFVHSSNGNVATMLKDVYYLYFTSGKVRLFNVNRGSGYNVRCVAE